MPIHYSENIASRTAIPASGLTDSTLLLDVYSGGERSLSLAELKKTGLNVVNVKQYGAVGDGVADDTAEIQAAITAALNASSQSSYTVQSALKSPTVYFPPGVYQISSPLLIGGNAASWNSATKLAGDGPYISVLRAVTGATSATLPYLINFSGTSTDANSYWSLDGIGVEGANPWNTGANIVGLNMLKSSYATVSNCMFRYFDKAVLIRNWSNTIEKTRFEYCTTGIYVSDASGIGGATTINDLIFTRNSFGTVDYGVHTAKSLPINYLKITDSQFDGYSRAAILFNGPIEQFQIANNYFELQGIDASGSSPATIYTNNSGGTTTCHGAIIMHPTTNNTVGADGQITGNFFINCNKSGIISSSANKSLIIRDNEVANASSGACLVNFNNAIGISSGPLSYSYTGRIFVDGTRDSVAQLVKLDNTNTAGNCNIVVQDRTAYTSRQFVLNDPADFTDIGGYTGTLVKSRASDGCVMFTHNSGTGSLGKEINLTVDANSPLSGALLRINGMVMCDDGTGALSAYITWDASGTPISTEHVFGASFSSGVWGKSRNDTYGVPFVTSGTKVLRIRLYRTTGIPGGTNTYLKNFAICSANYELGTEPILLID